MFILLNRSRLRQTYNTDSLIVTETQLFDPNCDEILETPATYEAFH
jgi:hypothetical protein